MPDPRRIFDLPAGFTYKVISRSGEIMSDGLHLPGQVDGQAAFAGPNGRVILVRNHELDPPLPQSGPFGADYYLLPKVDAARIATAAGIPTVVTSAALAHEAARSHPSPAGPTCPRCY